MKLNETRDMIKQLRKRKKKNSDDDIRYVSLLITFTHKSSYTAIQNNTYHQSTNNATQNIRNNRVNSHIKYHCRSN